MILQLQIIAIICLVNILQFVLQFIGDILDWSIDSLDERITIEGYSHFQKIIKVTKKRWSLYLLLGISYYDKKRWCM